jgi:predicted small lipoprotein YifL
VGRPQSVGASGGLLRVMAAAACAVLALASIAGCGEKQSTLTPPATVPPAATVTPTAPATPTAAASQAAWASLNCGRLDRETCLTSVRLVQKAEPALFGPKVAVIEDYLCGPGQHCAAGFHALVGLVQPDQPEVVVLFLVSGADQFDQPETVTRYPYPLPRFMQSLLPG